MKEEDIILKDLLKIISNSNNKLIYLIIKKDINGYCIKYKYK